MLDTSARLLSLLSLLQARPTGPVRSSPRDSRSASARCAATSSGCGRSATRSTPTPGVAGGYRLGAGAAMPPLLLDEEEAVAVAVALRTAASAA